jgi:hypothetical protein
MYSFGDDCSVETNVNATNLLVADRDIEEDFVGNNRGFGCETDVGEEEQT